MNTTMLLDSWTKVGSDFEEFARLIKDIDASTSIIPIETDALSLFSVIGSSSEALNLLVFNADLADLRTPPATSRIRIDAITEKGGTQEFLDEIMSTALIIGTDGLNKIMFTSHGLTRDLGARAQITGNGLIQATPERSAFLAHRYVASPCNANFIIRSNTSDSGRLKKIFAMPSAGYRYIPQSTLLEIADYFKDEMGGFESIHWEVSHNVSQIWLEFPKQAEDIAEVYKLPHSMVPGVLLETSDTGDCALKVIPTWKRAGGRSYLRAGEYKREHKGSSDLADITEKVKSTVFSVYTKLPERLCDLLSIDIPKPVPFWEVLFETVNIKSIIGKRRYTELLDAVQCEMNPALHYTAYDFAMRFSDLPAIFKDNWLREQLEALAYNVPFCDFNKMLKKADPLLLSA